MNSILNATTIAFFRQRLRKAEVIEELFKMFETYVRSQGLLASGGQVITMHLLSQLPSPSQRLLRSRSNAIPAKRTRKSNPRAARRLG
jgi:hypothetical protein